jgi:hypothetical protein
MRFSLLVTLLELLIISGGVSVKADIPTDLIHKRHAPLSVAARIDCKKVGS